MIIDCIADLHGRIPKLKGGDLLIVGGDLTARDTLEQHSDFLEWLCQQNYQEKVLIPGNHDNFLKENPNFYSKTNIHYLVDSGINFIKWNLKVWGSPWTPWFHGVNPRCKAYMKKDKELAKYWEKIPQDTDILITHGPPFGMLDKTTDGIYAGSKTLADKLLELELKFHIFGHIHEANGQCHQAYEEYSAACPDGACDGTTIPWGHLSINCSYVNADYEPVNKPVRIDYELEGV